MTYQQIILVIYLVYLVVMSVVTMILFQKDKKIATGGQSNSRIKEKTLLTGVVLGGSIGGFLGRILFHHKTNKINFSITIYLSLLLQLAVAVVFTVLVIL